MGTTTRVAAELLGVRRFVAVVGVTIRACCAGLDFCVQRGGDAINPDTNAVSAKLSPFVKRYGPIGTVLAERLSIFSHDVIGVMARYCAYGVAKEGTRPELLFSFPWMAGAYGCVSVQCSPDGDELWLCDGHRVRIFTAQGRFLRYLLDPADSSVSEPVAVAFSSKNNDAFVISGDTTQDMCVHAFRNQSAQMERIDPFADPLQMGYFCCPKYIAADSQGRIYVVHRALRPAWTVIYNICAFTCDGQPLPSLQNQLRGASMGSVTGIAIDAQDHLVVLDGQYAKVLDLKGNIAKNFLLSRENDDWALISLAVDRRLNHLVVLDRTHRLVRVFDLGNGAHITSFSAPRRPKCLSVDICGRIFVVCERSVYAYAFRV